MDNEKIENTVLHTILDNNKSYYVFSKLLSENTFVCNLNNDAFKYISSKLDKHEYVDFKTIVSHNSDLAYLFNSTAAYKEKELEAYVTELIRLESLRHQRRVSDKLSTMITDKSIPSEINEYVLSELSKTTKRGLNRRTNTQILSDLSNKVAMGGGLIGISTGYKVMDEFTGGWNPSNLIVMAARPGQGKTAEAISIMVNLAKNGEKVVYVNIEMDDTELMARIIAVHHDIVLGDILKGNVDMNDWNSKFLANMDFLDNITIISDLVKMTDIVSEIHYLHSRGMCDIAILDYLQLITGDLKGNREREVSSISLSCKNTAKALKIPVILLSQLSREVEKRPDKLPRLSDLRESGAIEQDADIVIFLYRPEYYGFEDFNGESSKGLMINLISKNRNGRTGNIVLQFVPYATRIQERSEDHFNGSYGLTKEVAGSFDPEF